MIKHLVSKLTKNDDDNMDVKNALNTICGALISKANEYKNSFDAATKEKFDKAISALNKEKSKVNNNESLNNLSATFDNLYLLTRQAAIAEVRKNLYNRYGDIDGSTFNNALFDKEVTEDLKEEGFTDNAINASKINIKTTATDTTDDGNADEGHADKASGDPDATSDTTSGSATGTTTTTTTTTSSTESNAFKRGQEVGKLLKGWTGPGRKEDIQIALSGLDFDDQDDIYEFLSGYYGNRENYIEGLIEKLDDDCGKKVTMDQKKKIIEAVIEKAKDIGLDKSDYEKLEHIYNKFITDTKDDEKTSFNKAYTYRFWRFLGLSNNYNEAIDKEMEKVFKKIREKVKSNTEN